MSINWHPEEVVHCKLPEASSLVLRAFLIRFLVVGSSQFGAPPAVIVNSIVVFLEVAVMISEIVRCFIMEIVIVAVIMYVG